MEIEVTSMDNDIQSLIKYLDDKGCEHCDYCKYQDECHGIACYGGEPVEPPCCYQEPDKYLDFDIIREEMEGSNNTVKEVERPAKVGEYIKIVNIYPIETNYENGDIFKVDECYPDGDVYVKDDDILVLYAEYVVLEGYDEKNKEYNEELKGNDDMNKVLKLYEERKLKKINDKYDKKVEDDYNAIEVVKQYNDLVNNFENKLEELFTSLDNFDNSYLVTQCDSNCYKYTLSEGIIKSKLASKYVEKKQREIYEVTKLVSEVDAQLALSDDLKYQLEVLSRYDIIDEKTNKMKV